MFNRALELRGDLTDLSVRHPALAARFIRVRDLLDDDPQLAEPLTADFAAGHPGESRAAGPDRTQDGRQRLAGDLAAVMAEIRAKEGFALFAQPPGPAELLRQAVAGPIVVFNVSRYRSDALLLTTDSIASLALPGLASETVISQVTVFHEALRAAAGGQPRAGRQLSHVLEWLWDAAAGPVLDALGYRTQFDPAMPRPRVWWAPGGLMGQLPIHAAGYHGDPSSLPGRRTVLDRVVSSYTPVVAALRHARRGTRPVASHGDSLHQAVRAVRDAAPASPSLWAAHIHAGP